MKPPFDQDMMLSHVCAIVQAGIDRGRININPECAVDLVVKSARLLSAELGIGVDTFDVASIKEALLQGVRESNEAANARLDLDRSKDLALVENALGRKT